jgi:hypothetical protein
MVDKGLSERRSLAIVGMSASAYRYETRPDGNEDLRQRIVALAQRHKRYGVGRKGGEKGTEAEVSPRIHAGTCI